ncbi:hypothetical protein LSAT2_021844 [Lamellibrachia satsuma]|nr:hypothetical protein LSAT2_021844 [Lamellibrachia satsuma]
MIIVLSSAQDHLVQFIRITLKQLSSSAKRHFGSFVYFLSSGMTLGDKDYSEMAGELFGRHASAAARTERQRNKLKERQAKKAIERRDTKRALKTDKVARMFEQAETRDAGKEKIRQQQGEKVRQQIQMRKSKTDTSEM